MITEKKAKVLRRKVLLFAAVVLRKEADGAEMPASKNDEEDEWMRSELTNIADDLWEEGHLP